MLITFPRRPQYMRMLQLSVRRQPHWRWLLAQNYEKSRRDPEVQMDKWIGAASRKVLTLVTVKSTAKRKAIDQAEQIWEQNGVTRWELEARLLANQTVAAVANAMSLPELVVEAYEAVFFDVRERLSKPDYIVGTVLQEHAELHPTNVSAVWSRYAYWQGLDVLEALLDHFRRRGWQDYTPIVEQEPLPERTEMDAALERDLLMLFLPTLDLDPVALARATREWVQAQEEAATYCPPPDFVVIPDEIVAAGEQALADAVGKIRRKPRKTKRKVS